jgi:hypothetical protein
MQQLNAETLTFKIGLSGTYWDKRPAYSILVDGVEQVSNFISCEPNIVEYEEFTLNLAEDLTHTLSIRLENKTSDDTVQNSDSTEIVKDMLLNIDSIAIDGVDLGVLKWSASEFVADDTARPIIKECVNLGWNGSYNLTFSVPFYLWLLENM